MREEQPLERQTRRLKANQRICDEGNSCVGRLPLFPHFPSKAFRHSPFAPFDPINQCACLEFGGLNQQNFDQAKWQNEAGSQSRVSRVAMRVPMARREEFVAAL